MTAIARPPVPHISFSQTDAPVWEIEPLVITPRQLAQVCRRLGDDQHPVSLLELQRLGVPRFVTRWLMEFANDEISERELVSAFVRHLQARPECKVTAAEFLGRLLTRQSAVLNNPALSLQERLALHSLNCLAGPLTDHWLDLTGTDSLALQTN